MLEKVEGNTFYIRGGNQSDMVNVTTRSWNSEFKAAMWPRGYPVVDVKSDVSNVAPPGSEA